MNASGRVVAELKPDKHYPKLWRIHMPDGRVSDMVNRTRAREAAVIWASAVMREQEKADAA
jgi:hypothetical protein